MARIKWWEEYLKFITRYRLQEGVERKKVYHFNLLKKWQKPETVEVFTALDDSQEGHSAESCEGNIFRNFYSSSTNMKYGIDLK